MNNYKIGIVGLGYVGLPLAVAFGEKYQTIGFDINSSRVDELRKMYDRTNELKDSDFKKATKLKFTSDEELLGECNIYIITVPTPIDKSNQPDLSILKIATETVGKYISNQDIIIYESTVYPTATNSVCAPILEKISNLTYLNEDNQQEQRGFYCAYSPERINPGDKENSLKKIRKIISGSTPECLEIVESLYNSIIDAGTIKANSIESAEAAKVIENTQRDLNIALINEFALIFNKLSIDTQEVLELAETKWNFIPMKPGLVGGHCIGVDPYYLAHKAIEIDYYPELILAGRKLNNLMGRHVAKQVLKIMTSKGISILNSEVLLMGITFKENCSDIRNTRVIDIITELKKYNCNITVYDPNADNDETMNLYDVELVQHPEKGKYDSIIIAVAHDCFIEMGIENIRSFNKGQGIIYDVKYLFPKDSVDGRL